MLPWDWVTGRCNKKARCLTPVRAEGTALLFSAAVEYTAETLNDGALCPLIEGGKNMNIAVAIDGPAGAGKSSVSKTVAKDMGFIYIDTGAMYRACALYAIENKLKIDEESLLPVLGKIDIEIKYSEGVQRIFLNGRDVSDDIRSAEVSLGASAIAVIPAVRMKLTELQRNSAAENNVIMDGRDIGTYVLPNADLKIYLTAASEARAKRRFDEMSEKTDLETVKRDIIKRDENDMNRAFAPLKKAEDAVVIDSSDMTFCEVVEKVKELILKTMGGKM